ncbi:MAG: L-seryl-tRNA(Sec) selenium transferase [Solirubrobacteraceae bacterium]
MGERLRSGLSALPAVHELAAQLDGPQPAAVAAARSAIDQHRTVLLAGGQPDDDLLTCARAQLAPSLRSVINATGVILHTNLGRAPLAAAARAAVARAAEGYANLELDLKSGERGSRHAHVAGLLSELTGAEDALAVNNGAGAVLLAVAALAGPGRAIVVSRGQLVEIGGGFRIPDVIAQAGATLIEVGTTNRTKLADYERALTPGAVILRVHQSNFRTVGFAEQVALEPLCRLGVPVIDDLGSGDLGVSSVPALGAEPGLRASVSAGAALVCCSGDKLLGGPQAGLLLGSAEAIAAVREHPLARALRIDKLSVAALEATLRLYRDPAQARREIPVLAMLERTADELQAMTVALVEAIGPGARATRASSRPGGGTLPLTELPGPAVALVGEVAPTELTAALRGGDPPVIARIHDGEVLLDPRTVAAEELAPLAHAARAALTAR